MNKFLLRFDDVAEGMSWSRFLPVKNRLHELGIKSLLGVVPENRDPTLEVEAPRGDFFDQIREWHAYGDCVAQHGTYHVYDTAHAGLLSINNRSEFAGHSYALQLERLTVGKARLEQEGIWQPVFMAPSHSFDINTLDALRDLEFIALTDGYGFYPYNVNGLTFMPCLTARPLYPTPGFCTICVHINTMDDQSIQRLLSFITRHRAKFISVEEALSIKPPNRMFSSVLQYLSRKAIHSIRTHRQRIARL